MHSNCAKINNTVEISMKLYKVSKKMIAFMLKLAIAGI